MEKKIVLVLSLMVLILIALAIIFISSEVNYTKSTQEKETFSKSDGPVIIEREPSKEIGEVYFPEPSGCKR